MKKPKRKGEKYHQKGTCQACKGKGYWQDYYENNACGECDARGQVDRKFVAVLTWKCVENNTVYGHRWKGAPNHKIYNEYDEQSEET